jgi:serine/threonine protein kinase
MAREITIMKLLKHKNILRLYDIYENEEKIFLILDLYEGGDLYGYLTQQGARPLDEALLLFKQIISGVEYCHKCMIVHRDLKPENLLLSADKKALVISDFGLSTGMQGSRNLLKTRCGTVHYISPEVAKGDLYVGMASDVWSMGIILYAMVTATLPFDGPNSVAVLKKIVRGEFHMPAHLPKELQDLIRLMLTLDPKGRITIQQIKQHPWYLGLPDETPRTPTGQDLPEEPYIVDIKELKENSDVISNLKLLGWEESELMNELLDTKMTMAKTFYKLLIEHKNLPMEEDEPKIQKVMRRRSIGASAIRGSRIGVTADPSKPEVKSKTTKRASQRASVRRSVNVEKRSTQEEEHAPKARKQNSQNSQSSNNPLANSGSAISVTTSSTPSKSTSKNVVWGVSPTLEPEAKKYEVESNKSVTQLLEALKHCFADLGQYDISAKQTKNGIKVKARKSGKRHGHPVVTVNLLQREGETSVILKGGKSKEEFKELAKKVEETLVV